MKKMFILFFALTVIILLRGSASCTVIFTDDFSTNNGWGNQRGAWEISSGVYDAKSPANSPPTYSSAPTSYLSNFSIEFDVNDVSDGGIWLRSSYFGGKASGLLMIIGGHLGTFSGIYWHVVIDDNYGYNFGETYIPGLQGSDAHFKIDVFGDTYNVYCSGGETPISTVIDHNFAAGLVAFYDYSIFGINQTIDNVIISTSAPIPEPVTMLLLSCGLVGMAGFRRKHKEA